ncbi:MAG: hypothetical protein ACRC41_18095 [Sarcina sp.]
MKDLEVMKLQSENLELVARMNYAATLIKEIRHELNNELTDEKVKELKDYASDISDFLGSQK